MDKYTKIKQLFEQNRDEENAVKMSKYMRDLFKFYGLATPLRKSFYKDLLKEEKVNKVAGNGIFLSICIFLVFLLFGAFGAKWFISLFANGNNEVISMGTTYLQICCCLSLGSIGYTVYERFLQSTGKTMLSTISQISGTRLTLLQVIINKVIMLVKRSLINNDKSHIGYEW